MKPIRSRGPVRPLLVAVAVSCASLLGMTAAVIGYSRHGVELANERFDGVARQVTERVAQRLHIYEYGLQGSRGAAITAGIEQLTAAQYTAYSASRDITREFPGAHGIGLIRRVSPAEELEFLNRVRRDIAPSFSVRQLEPHAGDRYVIELVAPLSPNVHSLGLDIASEQLRREAADAAARTASPTLTAPITLVQATDQVQKGFLLLLPIYASGAPVTTEAQRARATRGWTYAPLVASEVLALLQRDTQYSLGLSDKAAPAIGNFFETPGFDQPAAAGIERRLSLSIYGRTWDVQLRATPSFIKELNLVSTGSLVGLGLAMSGLLAGLSYVYSRDSQRRQQLRAEQARRAAIVDGSQDAVIGETIDGMVTDWNAGAERMFGYSAEQALGRPAASLILPEERAREDEALRLMVAGGELPPTFDSTRRRVDGTLLDVSVNISPIVATDGLRIGFSKTIRDISTARRAEREVTALNARLEQLVDERTRALAAARRHLQNILDAVPSLIGYWDQELRIRFANKAHESWFGVTADALPGVPAGTLFGASSSQISSRADAALRGEPQTFYVELPGATAVRHCVVHLVPDVVDGVIGGAYVLAYDYTAQRQIQDQLGQALRDKEALFATVHEHAIVSVTDATGRIIDANSHFSRTSGYTREELLGKTHAIVNSGTHDRHFWSELWRTIASGRHWHGVICNRAKDGSLYWVDSIITPLFRPDGGIEQYLSIRFDITAVKRAEADLQQAHARIALATDAAGIGIWELDVRAGQLTWDAWMYRLYGQTPGDGRLPDAVWQRSVFHEDKPRMLREVADVLGEGGTFDTEFRIVRPDGDLRHIKAYANVIRDTDGSPVRMIGVNFDVTERKRVEVELLSASSLLSNVLNAASEVSLIATDRQLCINVFNHGAEQLLGFQASELVGQATPLVIHDLEEVRARAAELSALSGERVEAAGAFIHPLALRQPREWTYVRKDGSRVTVSLVVTAMSGADGEIFGYLGVAHDVTRQKQYEASLHEAMRKAEDASRAKSEFLANISHEIRTPMNAVIGLSYLLERTALDVEQSAILSRLRVAGQTLLALLNDVLDLSKIEAGELSLEEVAFDLPDVLTNLEQLYGLEANAKGIDFHVSSPASLPACVLGDVTRLNQILSNLLANAVKFTERGGVQLNVREQARGGSDSVLLRFEVVDTGIGMSANEQARLFAPFAQADASTTRRFGGTGLGLSIVRRLAHLMGGTVGVSSAPGTGSTFWAQLPFVVLPGHAPAPSQEGDGAGGTSLLGLRVLLVDDSDVNLFVARKILQTQGALIELAHNGVEAVEALRKGPKDYDVVLMDIQMPVMDGREATRRIRNELGLTQLPIVALTADARASERQLAFGMGMNDLLSKPLKPELLFSCLRQYTQKAPQRLDAAASVPSGDAWPEVEGIDSSDVRRRLAGDKELFEVLLATFVEGTTEPPPVLSPAPTETELQRLAAYAHRMRGSAGNLGALGLQALSKSLEAHCHAGDAEQARRLTEQLRATLQRLLASMQAVLQRERSRVHAPAGEPESGALTRLQSLLSQHSLDVLDEVQRLAPQVRQVLGDENCAVFHRHVEQLRFDEAVALLQRARLPEAELLAKDRGAS